MAREIRRVIAAAPFGHFLIPFDNYVGKRLVRYGWGGSFGVMMAPRLFARGAKRWGEQRVHPALELKGEKRFLKARMIHYVDRSEEHTSELQSLMRISYAVFCLKKKINTYSITKMTSTNDMPEVNTNQYN